MFRHAFVLFLFQTVLAVCPPKLTLFHAYGGNLTITSNQPTLPTGYSISSPAGTWVQYGSVNYTASQYEVLVSIARCDTIEASIEDNAFPFYIRSVRMAGSPLDAYIPAITLYELEMLEGEYAVLVEGSGLPTFNSTIGSLIGMNRASIEFFTGENYMGDSFCLFIDSFSDVLFDFHYMDTPWHIPDSRSARFGCDPATPKIVINEQVNKYVQHKS